MLVIGAGFLFSLLDATAKYLVREGMSAPFVAWSRFAVHVILVLVLFRAWSNGAMFRAVSLPLQALRSVFLFGSTIFNFLALITLPLADAMAIYFFSPMLITALAGPLLGEWAGWRRWAAIGVGFLGMLIVTRPGLAEFGVGHVYALGSMLSYSIYVIMTRSMGRRESAESLIFYSALVPALLMAPTLMSPGRLPDDVLPWIILASLGVYGAVGHYLLIRAYKLASASALAPYPYLQIVYAVALGYAIFRDLPDIYTLVGAFVIILSGLYIVNRERILRLGQVTEPNAEANDLAKKL